MKFGSIHCNRLTASLTLALGLGVAVVSTSTSAAEDYPTAPIKIVNPFTPGGPNDQIARLLGQKLTERWKQPIVVDQRAGAGGIIGSDVVAKSAPDGYSLLMAASSHAVNVSFIEKLPFDAVRDFTPIINTAASPYVLIVHPDFAAKTIGELIAYAKANPGKVTYASPGVGAGNHLAGELFASTLGINIRHIPYKGSAPANTDLLAGRVTMMFQNMVSALPLVTSGRMRALAVTSLKRSVILPDLPTLAESGLPGFDVSGWYCLMGPGGMKPELVKKLNTELASILELEDVKRELLRIGVEPQGGTSEEAAELIKKEINRWAKVAASIKKQ